MRVITEPHVEVVAITEFLPHTTYRIPKDGDSATKLGAFCAKMCYDSFGEAGRSNIDNQNAIISSGHGSVLEHFHISVAIEGITRGLSLELNRHRHFAISQRSTRYTAEEDCAIVLDPYYARLYNLQQSGEAAGTETLTEDEKDLLSEHLLTCQNAILRYQSQVEQLMEMNPENLAGRDLRKWARGKARNVLPHALETRGVWTANIRAWRHVLEMRSERFAEAEIRRLAGHLFNAVSPWAPQYFEDYKMVQVHGMTELQTPYRKV